MAIQITAVQLDGGLGHEHIARLRWTSDTQSDMESTRAQIAEWIEDSNGTAYTDDGRGHRAWVAVRTPERGPKYLQTHADNVWTNNLLALPRW